MNWQSQSIAWLAASVVRPWIPAAAAWLILRAARVRHPASRHAVWAAVLIAMLLLPFATVLVPHWTWRLLPAAPVPAAAAGTLPAPLAVPPLDPTLPPPVFPASRRPAESPQPAVNSPILWCYLAGLLAMSSYRAMGCVLLWRMRSRSTPLRRGLRESADVLTPVAVGVLRPAVILPAGWRAWDTAMRRAVLAHEFAHLRRRDSAVSALARFGQCLFWFQPLAWWLSRRIADLAELACDAAALDKLNDPAGYARVLLAMAATVNRAGYRAALPGLAMAAGSDMGRRIDQVFELSRGPLTQRSRPAALLALAGVPILGLAATIAVTEQTAPPQPQPQVTFEVASVKPAATDRPADGPIFCIVPCSLGERFIVAGSRVDIRNMSLDHLIAIAYRLRPYQLSAPDWTRSPKFDIEAKLPAGVSKDRIPDMLQTLLAERFKLAIHRESKEQPVYALVVEKGGPKLRVSTEEPNAASPAPGTHPMYTPQGEGRALESGGFEATDGAYGHIRSSGPGRGPHGGMQIEFLKLTMARLVDVLTPHVDRPVVDRTNLQGPYYLASETHPPSEGGGRKGAGDGADSGPRPDPFGEALLAAVQRAGLKLEKTRAPVVVVVVDRLEKAATAN